MRFGMLFAGLSGCAVSDPGIAVDDDIATFAVATWSAAGDVRSRVEVDGPDGPWLVTDWEAPEAIHSANLLGLLPDTEWTARAVTEDGKSSNDIPFSTGALPPEVPGYTTAGAPGWEGYLLTAFIGDPSMVVILDEAGRVVWYRQAKTGERVLRVRLRPDGSGLRYAEIEPVDITEKSALIEVDWGGQETSRVAVDKFHHDFADAEGGGAACLVTDIRPGRSGADVQGDSIVVVDADGTQTPVWSSWDVWEPPADSSMEKHSWTHANAIDNDPEGGGYWLGLRDLSAIVQVLPDGSVGTQLAGEGSSYTFPEPADKPKFQHQFQMLDGGVLMFDDRDPTTGEDSRLLELNLDDSATTATASWTWHHDPTLSIYALGDVDRAPDGSTLGVYSSAGVIVDLSPEGEVRWELGTELAVGIPYVVRLAELPGVQRVR